MRKKKFTPVEITKLVNPAKVVSKHYQGNIEAITPVTFNWYQNLPIKKLMQQFGSPLFIVCSKVMQAQQQLFEKIFNFPGYRTIIAYSFKTNYLPAICQSFIDNGCWAEVVSEMEHTLAEKLQTPPGQIVFNGPYKTECALVAAIKHGSLIHIDNFAELEAIEKIASTLEIKAKVGIRFNFAYQNHAWDKFGFGFCPVEITQVLQKIKASQHLVFKSIHNHCGTYMIEPKIYSVSLEYIYQIAQIAQGIGLEPEFIDLGGGFPSSTILKAQFNHGLLSEPPELLAYADAMDKGLKALSQLIGKQLTLILEPGRALIDEAVILCCQVIATKKGQHGARIVITDAGVNILPTSYWYQRKPVVVDEDSRQYCYQKICGSLCMQIDVINDNVYLPELTPFTHLIYPNVGAYNHTQSMQFIHYRPATIMVDEHNATRVIRRKETFDNVFARDVFPERA